MLILTSIKFNSNNTNNAISTNVTNNNCFCRATDARPSRKHLEVVLTASYRRGKGGLGEVNEGQRSSMGPHMVKHDCSLYNHMLCVGFRLPSLLRGFTVCSHFTEEETEGRKGLETYSISQSNLSG